MAGNAGKKSDRPRYVAEEYYYRRELTSRDLLPAMGAAVGVGAAAFYLAKLWLERTLLDVVTVPSDRAPTPPRHARGDARAAVDAAAGLAAGPLPRPASPPRGRLR